MFESGFEKSSLTLAENPLFFPNFPDWKKSSKMFLISLIGWNPADLHVGCGPKLKHETLPLTEAFRIHFLKK